jgi:cytochrome c oxidase assembly protein subunit 15
MESIQALKKFRRVSLLTIFSVLFLIWVGGLVRSTGSGMGCPDWPKCFGVWIPPTAESQLPPDYLDHFVELRKKKNDRLAKMLITFGMNDLAYRIQNDPAINEHEPFNATKTWIEYVNRIVGVLVGFFIFLTLLASWRLKDTNKNIFWLSLAGFIGVLFEGWLGSIVVSTNLLPVLITVHMLVAMLVLVVLIIAYMRAREEQQTPFIPKSIAWLGVGISMVALVQVLFGTQVREMVDVVAKTLGTDARERWIENLGFTYLVHIRFYWLLVFGIAFWIYKLKPYFQFSISMKRWVMGLITLLLVEVLLGISMHYFAIPPIIQPLHLLLGTGIFTLSYFITASLFNSGKIR